MTRTPVPLPPREELQRVFLYSPSSGELIWRARDDVPRRVRKRFAGKPAGHKSNRGYVQVWAWGRLYLAHRIVWKMHHGDEPAILDHIDGDPANNRIENLRPASQVQNQANRKRTRGRELPKGVRRTTAGNFLAVITARGHRGRYLGTFPTVEQAQAAYFREAQAAHGEYARAE
ncbi:putative HNH endonuclease [Microcystis phage Mwe-JY08]